MVRLSFTLDVIDSKLVTVNTAYYRVDGTLRLEKETGMIFEESGFPLVELAEWLSRWLAEPQTAGGFLPNGYDEDYGPSLQLTPAGKTYYRLDYNDGSVFINTIAESTEWETAFQLFLQDLRHALQQQYQVALDAILLRFISPT